MSCRHRSWEDDHCKIDVDRHCIRESLGCPKYSPHYSWRGPGISHERVPSIRASLDVQPPALRLFVGVGRLVSWGWSLLDRSEER